MRNFYTAAALISGFIYLICFGIGLDVEATPFGFFTIMFYLFRLEDKINELKNNK